MVAFQILHLFSVRGIINFGKRKCDDKCIIWKGKKSTNMLQCTKKVCLCSLILHENEALWEDGGNKH